MNPTHLISVGHIGKVELFLFVRVNAQTIGNVDAQFRLCRSFQSRNFTHGDLNFLALDNHTLFAFRSGLSKTRRGRRCDFGVLGILRERILVLAGRLLFATSVQEWGKPHAGLGDEQRSDTSVKMSKIS